MDTTTQEAPGTDTVKLKAELKQLRDDIRELTGTLRGVIAGKARQSEAKARETLDEAGEKIGEHPFLSLLVAPGAGFLVGLLLERNRRS